jgi:hypothetical protein
VVQHNPPDAAPARLRRGVHRLELSVLGVELLDSPDAEHRTSIPVTEERDRRLDQGADVEREAVLGRRLGQAERQVPLKQRPNVRLTWVINDDLADSSHRGIVVNRPSHE